VPNKIGLYLSEFVPKTSYSAPKRARLAYMRLRSLLGLKLYYWQLRFLFDDPKFLKLYDFEFMRHVRNEHHGMPNIFIEKLHFFIARIRYRKVQNINEKHAGKVDIPEWRITYHGVTWNEYQSLVQLVIKRHESEKERLIKSLGVQSNQQ
jgi:hypothetical protein